MKQHRDRYDNQDDATLVASILAREREVFDILLSRYSSSVLRLCTALLGNPFEAQDIAQEAALQAFLGLSRLQEPARFAPWFHAIAANLAALLLNPQGTLSAWKGPDAQDTLERFSSKLFHDISRHGPLANERELELQLGRQPQKAFAAYGDKKAVLQELPEKIGGVMVAAVHPGGWRLVVIFAEKPARDLEEETRQNTRQTRRELSVILTQ